MSHSHATYYWSCSRCGALSTSESGITTPWPRSPSYQILSTSSLPFEPVINKCLRPECLRLQSQISHPIADEQSDTSPLPKRPQQNQERGLPVGAGGRLYRCDEHGKVLFEMGLQTDEHGVPIGEDGRVVDGVYGYDAFGRRVQDGKVVENSGNSVQSREKN